MKKTSKRPLTIVPTTIRTLDLATVRGGVATDAFACPNSLNGCVKFPK